MKIEEAIDQVERTLKGAYSNISFRSEEVEKRAAESFARQLKEYAAEVEKIDPESVDDFVKRYTAKAVDYEGAHRNVASAAIVGPARFPTARMEKRWDSIHKKLNKYLSFPKWYIKTLKKRKDREFRKSTGYDLPSAELERQKKKLQSLKDLHENMKAANKAIRSKKNVVEKLKELGFSNKTISEIQQPDYAGRVGFASFYLTNNNANIKRVEQRIKELSQKAAAVGREEPKLVFDGGYVIKNNEEDRLQIIFDGIPDVSIRTALKKNGYRWSPKQKAWQRKLTPNALYSIRNLYEILGIKNEDVKAYNASTKELNKKEEEPKAKNEITKEEEAQIDAWIDSTNERTAKEAAKKSKEQKEVMDAYWSRSKPKAPDPTAKPKKEERPKPAAPTMTIAHSSPKVKGVIKNEFKAWEVTEGGTVTEFKGYDIIPAHNTTNPNYAVYIVKHHKKEIYLKITGAQTVEEVSKKDAGVFGTRSTAVVAIDTFIKRKPNRTNQPLEHKKPTPPAKEYDFNVVYTPYPKDSNYDAVSVKVFTKKVFGNRYKITWLRWRSNVAKIDITKIDNNPFGGVMGKEFETFAEAERAYKSPVIKDAIASLKSYVEINYDDLMKRFDDAKPNPEKERARALAIAIAIKYKYQ